MKKVIGFNSLWCLFWPMLLMSCGHENNLKSGDENRSYGKDSPLTDLPPQFESQVDAYIQKFERVPNSGVAIAIVKNGKTIFEKGYGYKDQATKSSVDSHTIFGIGSNTKMFTSATIAAEHIDIKTPIKKYIPNFKMSDKYASTHITLEDLLSHRSGLPDSDIIDDFAPFSRENLVDDRIQYLPLNPNVEYGFGSKWVQYNNLNYAISADVLEKFAKNTWEDEVRKQLLNPIGMNETNFSIIESSKYENFAKPYAGNSALTPLQIYGMAPAGAMNSNLNDLEKWVATLQSIENNENTNLFTKDDLENLWQPRTDATQMLKTPTQYGLGWFISTIDGNKRLVWHGGNITGYSSHISLLPEKGLALIILTNQNAESQFEFPFMTKQGTQNIPLLPLYIYNLILKNSDSEIDLNSINLSNGTNSSTPHDTPLVINNNSTSPFDSSEYSSVYNNKGYGEIKIFENNKNELIFDYYGTQSKLTPTDKPDIFFITLEIEAEHPQYTVSFQRSNNEVTGFTVNFQPITAPIALGPVQFDKNK